MWDICQMLNIWHISHPKHHLTPFIKCSKCHFFATCYSTLTNLAQYGRNVAYDLLFFYLTFLSPLTSLIDFFSLLTICLSLPTGVLSSKQTQKSSFFFLCTSKQTPIPSSKQNREMESSQTQKEQRNRRWRRGRAWCQGWRSHEDRRASNKQGS